MRPRLFLHVVVNEMRTAVAYRVDFWLHAVVDFAVQFGVVYFLWQAMFAESGSEMIGGYTYPAMVVYYLAVILLGKLVRGRQFESSVSDDIYQGGLNRYIVFPVPYLPFKYAQHLGLMPAAVLQVALFGLVAPLVIDIPSEFHPTAASAAMALGAVAVGNVLHYLLSFPIQAVAFWADNVWSLEVAKRFFTTILGGYLLPLEVFPKAMQHVLEWLPFRFFFHFPAKVLLNDVPAAEWGRGMVVALAWCAAFGALSRWVWHRGQLTYTGVGI